MNGKSWWTFIGPNPAGIQITSWLITNRKWSCHHVTSEILSLNGRVLLNQKLVRFLNGTSFILMILVEPSVWYPMMIRLIDTAYWFLLLRYRSCFFILLFWGILVVGATFLQRHPSSWGILLDQASFKLRHLSFSVIFLTHYNFI